MAKRPRNRYANIVSTLALVLSLGGTATAAGFAHLITGTQVEAGSLTGRNLANSTIGLNKLTPAALARLEATTPGPAGAPGAPGPQGTAGPEGAQGPAGSAISLAGYVTTDDQTIPGDGDPHTIWTINVTAQDRQVFILTGAIGGSNINGGCSGSGGTSDHLMVDGTPPGGNYDGFLTLTPGAHTVSYVAEDTCTGEAADVPAQQAVLIPFTTP